MVAEGERPGGRLNSATTGAIVIVAWASTGKVPRPGQPLEVSTGRSPRPSAIRLPADSISFRAAGLPRSALRTDDSVCFRLLKTLLRATEMTCHTLATNQR